MVIRDLSDSNVDQNSGSRRVLDSYSIASPMDRLFALMLDILLLTPISGFMMAWLTKDIRLAIVIGRDPSDIMGLWILFGFGYILTLMALLALALYYLQASPGQRIMKLRVVSYPEERKKLNFSQCVLRAVLYFSNFLVLGLTYLEIFSHEKRRMFHERASDTMVVSLKKVSDNVPRKIEQNLARLWARYMSVAMALLLILIFGESYRSLQVHQNKISNEKSEDHSEPICLKSSDGSGAKYSDLDFALFKFLTGEGSRECLEREISAVFWDKMGQDSQLAYFAKGLISDGEDQKSYFSKVCEGPSEDSELCDAVRAVSKGNQRSVRNPIYLTSAYLRLKENLEEERHLDGLKEIHFLREAGMKSPYLEKNYTRLIWILDHSSSKGLNNRARRAPANREEKNQVEIEIKKFQKEMGLL